MASWHAQSNQLVVAVFVMARNLKRNQDFLPLLATSLKKATGFFSASRQCNFYAQQSLMPAKCNHLIKIDRTGGPFYKTSFKMFLFSLRPTVSLGREVKQKWEPRRAYCKKSQSFFERVSQNFARVPSSSQCTVVQHAPQSRLILDLKLGYLKGIHCETRLCSACS